MTWCTAVVCRETEEREAALMSDLREAEAVVAERDLLAVRVNALEEKLNESRTERTQIDNYKQARNPPSPWPLARRDLA